MRQIGIFALVFPKKFLFVWNFHTNRNFFGTLVFSLSSIFFKGSRRNLKHNFVCYLYRNSKNINFNVCALCDWNYFGTNNETVNI